MIFSHPSGLQRGDLGKISRKEVLGVYHYRGSRSPSLLCTTSLARGFSGKCRTSPFDVGFSNMEERRSKILDRKDPIVNRGNRNR